MKVRGDRTVKEYIDVEIDAVDLLHKMYKACIPAGLDHIDDGYWYRVDGPTYHRQDPTYEKVREATKEELQLQAAYVTMHKAIRANKL